MIIYYVIIIIIKQMEYKIIYGDFGNFIMMPNVYYYFKIDNVEECDTQHLFISILNNDLLEKQPNNIYKLTSFDNGEDNNNIAKYICKNDNNEILTIEDHDKNMIFINAFNDDKRTQVLNLLTTTKIKCMAKGQLSGMLQLIIFENNMCCYGVLHETNNNNNNNTIQELNI